MSNRSILLSDSNFWISLRGFNNFIFIPWSLIFPKFCGVLPTKEVWNLINITIFEQFRQSIALNNFDLISCFFIEPASDYGPDGGESPGCVNDYIKCNLARIILFLYNSSFLKNLINSFIHHWRPKTFHVNYL